MRNLTGPCTSCGLPAPRLSKGPICYLCFSKKRTVWQVHVVRLFFLSGLLWFCFVGWGLWYDFGLLGLIPYLVIVGGYCTACVCVNWKALRDLFTK